MNTPSRSASPAAPTLMALLKAETRAAHEATEQAFNLKAVLQSKDAYAHLLQRLHRFYSVIEPMLATWDWASLGLDFDARRKLPWLEADLTALSASPHAEVIEPLPALSTQAEALGALYVLEGSTLGGQIITKRVQSELGFSPHSGLRFFSGYQLKTGVYWHQFVVAANIYGQRNAQGVVLIISGALSTFSALERYLLHNR
ncbi:MAG: biliverdin-producing heme oxygenase [Rhodothermales bacterium]